jgi:dTDP-D-glucose 4,6-dehydratase
MKVFDSPAVKLEYTASKMLLTQVWTGFATSEQFREGIDKTVDFIGKNAVKVIVSDTRNQKVVKPEDSKYAASVMPKLFGNGLKAMAFVMPEDIFTKMSLSSFSKEQAKPDYVQYFGNMESAEQWISKYCS